MNPAVVRICLKYNLKLWEVFTWSYSDNIIITGTGIGVRVKPKKRPKSFTTASFEQLSVFVNESKMYALNLVRN